MINIILCGGNGTRLWPLSRTLMPKQFVKLFEGESLFQQTVPRNQKACNSQFIVSNTEQYFLAVDQMEELCTVHRPWGTYNIVPADKKKVLHEALDKFGIMHDRLLPEIMNSAKVLKSKFS